jgi:hypothetical protein
MTRSSCVFAFAFSLACGSDDPGPTQSNLIQVGGRYATAVTLGTNSCTGVTVQPQPTTVTHTAGATSFSLAHGPLTYFGTLQSDGRFTTTPQSVSGGGATSTLRIAGQFSRTGFTATVTVDQTGGTPATCTYVVQWVGTKEGAPNIIP